MIKSLEEIAELMRSNLFQLDNETEEEIKEVGIISKYQEELLEDLENAIHVLKEIKEVK